MSPIAHRSSTFAPATAASTTAFSAPGRREKQGTGECRPRDRERRAAGHAGGSMRHERVSQGTLVSRLPRHFHSPSLSLPLAIPVTFPRLPLAFHCRMPRRPRPLSAVVLRTVRNVACGPVLGDGVWVLERVVLRRVRLRTRRPCGQETAARGSEAGPFSRAKAALESARNGASSNVRFQGALRTQRVPQAPPPPPLEPLLPLRAPPLVLPSPPSSFPKVGKSDTSSA